MSTAEQPSDAVPPVSPAPDVPAAAQEKPVAEQKSSEHLSALAESISKPLVAAVSGLAGMLTSLRDQFQDIDPETLRLLRKIPILNWFLPDPDAPATAGTGTPETPEAVAEKIQKAIVEIKKTNTDLGKKLDAKLAKVTALTDATAKQNGLTILEKDCEFIAVASGVIGDAKIGQVPEEKRGPLKFEDRLSKILADFPLEETDLTKATEKRETAHAVLTTLETDVDLAIKIATNVPEAERETFYTRLATISAAHGEGKVDDVAKDFKTLQTEVGAFETQAKQELSAEELAVNSKAFVDHILIRIFGISYPNVGQQNIDDLKTYTIDGFISAGDLWNNVGSSDDNYFEKLQFVLKKYVAGNKKIPLDGNTVYTFLQEIYKQGEVDAFKNIIINDQYRAEFQVESDGADELPQWAPFNPSSTQGGPSVSTTVETPSPDLTQQRYTKINEQLAPLNGQTVNFDDGQIVEFAFPYIDQGALQTIPCKIAGGNSFRIGGHAYTLELPASAQLQKLEIKGPVETGSTTLTAGAFMISDSKTIPLETMISYLDDLRTGPASKEITIDGQKATFKKVA